ncbi:MAG: restriction endonuclease subunit S [Chloroflexota bacterium]
MARQKKAVGQLQFDLPESDQDGLPEPFVGKEVGSTPLPVGWKWVKIEDVANTTSGGTPSRKHIDYYGGNIAWIKSGELRDGIIRVAEETITEAGLKNSSAKIFPRDTVVVALYGATVGRTGVLGIDAATNQAVCALFPRNNAFTPMFMFYWLQSQRQNLINQSMGGAQPNISQGIIRSLLFPLPPLPEQQRIVARIEELFSQLEAGAAALRRVQAGLKRYKASVLKAACEGRLAAQDPGDEAAAVMLRRLGKEALEGEGLGEVPEGWCWAQIEQIAEHRLGKMLDKEKNRGELQPYLRNINVRWFEFDFSDIQYMRVTKEELANVSVQKNDLIVCEGGEPGRAAVWNRDDTMVIQKALHRVRPAKCVLPIYLAFCLAKDANTGRLTKYFTGSTIKHFTGQSLDSYIFPLPPLAEQHRIVAEVERRLSLAQEVEAAAAGSLQRAGRLRQAVLKAAFEGRYKVNLKIEESSL